MSAKEFTLEKKTPDKIPKTKAEKEGDKETHTTHEITLSLKRDELIKSQIMERETRENITKQVN